MTFVVETSSTTGETTGTGIELFFENCDSVELDNSGDRVNTFIDDIVGALAAAVAAKVSHKHA